MRLSFSVVFPCRNIGKLRIIPLRLPVGCLVLLPEVGPARLLPVEGIRNKQFCQLEIVSYPSCLFQFHVQLINRSRNNQVLPELLPELPYHFESLFQARLIARHAAMVPHNLSKALMER